MKIVEICFSLASGGAERFVVDLSNELNKENTVILQRLSECAAINGQLSDAGSCISFMEDQYNRARELENEAAR